MKLAGTSVMPRMLVQIGVASRSRQGEEKLGANQRIICLGSPI